MPLDFGAAGLEKSISRRLCSLTQARGSFGPACQTPTPCFSSRLSWFPLRLGAGRGPRGLRWQLSLREAVRGQCPGRTVSSGLFPKGTAATSVSRPRFLAEPSSWDTEHRSPAGRGVAMWRPRDQRRTHARVQGASGFPSVALSSPSPPAAPRGPSVLTMTRTMSVCWTEEPAEYLILI